MEKNQPKAQAQAKIERLLEIMRALRNPQTGCPWDQVQTHESLKSYAIEEAYEVVEAIEMQNDDALKSELGDYLFQVVFHAEIAREGGRFDFSDIVEAISEKMIARHPHVFGDAHERSIKEQRESWEAQKAQERGELGTLEGIARTLPPLSRAYKMQKRLARVGFDWENEEGARDKLIEELEELSQAASYDEQVSEFGDALFALVNYGRKLGINPDEALALTNKKVANRFGYIENVIKKTGNSIENASLDEMNALWEKAKTLKS